MTLDEERYKILFREYALGHLTMREVATLLGHDVVDVLVEFEHLGDSRTIDQNRLNAFERSTILERIERDRLARGGEPVYSADAVARDVIASERLERVAGSCATPSSGAVRSSAAVPEQARSESVALTGFRNRWHNRTMRDEVKKIIEAFDALPPAERVDFSFPQDDDLVAAADNTFRSFDDGERDQTTGVAP